MNAFWVEAARCRSSEMRRRRRRCLMKNYKVCMSHRYPRRWCRAYLYSITLIAGGFVYTIFFACACSFWLSIIFDALSFTVDVPKQTLWRGCESVIAKKEHQKYKRTHIQIYLGWFL